MPESTLWLDKKEHGWTFCSLGGYSQCLHMCKLYDIRKRKRTTCTHAAAGPEQLPEREKAGKENRGKIIAAS